MGEGLRTCPRCASLLRLVRPWRGWRPLRVVWLGFLGCVVLGTPFVSFDYVVILPGIMVMMAATGPLLGLAEQKPTCRRCGLAFSHDGTRIAD